MERPHLVLVGLMGAGKTTVGRKVARLLDRPFLDADVELVSRTGRPVADWFATDGEAAFRAAEADVLGAMLAAAEPTVVATGGGAVVSADNRARLAAPDVFVVWLRAEPAFLASRVAQKAHRPLLAGDPLVVLTRLSAEREGWYGDVADAVIDVAPAHRTSEQPKWALAELVVDALRQRVDQVDTEVVR